MNRVPITIPQMGEGLVEARVVAFLKQPGQSVRRDEPLIELETDKAVLVVESPTDGIVGDWNAQEGETLPLGFEIGAIATENPVTESSAIESVADIAPLQVAPLEVVASADNLDEVHSNGASSNGAANGAAQNGATSNGASRNADISPRVRAFCAEKGVALDQVASIAREGDVLRVSDVERWLAAQDKDFADRQVTPRQKQVAQRLARAWQQAVPASIELECSWDALHQARALVAPTISGVRLSSLHLISWCVVSAMHNHPNFRSALVGASTLREYRHVSLGIAVGLPGDGLTTAPLMQADTLAFPDFVAALQNSIELARGGRDAEEGVQLTISKMTNQGIHYAVPVIVPPAVSTLFIGAPYEVPRRNPDDSVRWEKIAQFVLTFDHRIINGVGAAQFLQEIQTRIASLPREFA